MITLYKFVPIPQWNLPDMSPFCLKVETYLRMSNHEYGTAVGDTRKAPKGKLPFIEVDGQRIADSGAILAHLETKGGALDVGFDAKQRATATAVRAMLEEHLYWIAVYFRWKEDAGWKLYKPMLLPLAPALGVPSFVTPVMLSIARRQVLAALHAQGTGRHTSEEVAATGARILDAVSDLMSPEGPFFFGARPSTLDATVYAFLASVLFTPIEGPFLDHARKKANLVSYVDRMRARYWTDAPSA